MANQMTTSRTSPDTCLLASATSIPRGRASNSCTVDISKVAFISNFFPYHQLVSPISVLQAAKYPSKPSTYPNQKGIKEHATSLARNGTRRSSWCCRRRPEKLYPPRDTRPLYAAQMAPTHAPIWLHFPVMTTPSS